MKNVHCGISIRASAKEHNIPESSLRRRLKANRISPPRVGVKAIFTKEHQEQILAAQLVHLSNSYYGVTQDQSRKAAFDMAEKLKLKHSFNKTKKSAGKGWFANFLKRNPILSIRKPEATSLNRIKSFNKDEITKFFDNLLLLIEKYHFTPSRIFNMDETRISTVQVQLCAVLLLGGLMKKYTQICWNTLLNM